MDTFIETAVAAKAPGSETPAGATERSKRPDYAAPSPAPVARMSMYRVAPAGTTRAVVDIAKRQLGIARDAIAFGGWTQGVNAVGEGDFECDPTNHAARAWSLGGALLKAFGAGEYWHASPADVAMQAVRMSIKQRHGCTAMFFNDMVASRSEDVTAEINAAIDLLDEIITERGL